MWKAAVMAAFFGGRSTAFAMLLPSSLLIAYSLSRLRERGANQRSSNAVGLSSLNGLPQSSLFAGNSGNNTSVNPNREKSLIRIG